MYIKSFGINLDKSKKLWAIISLALLVAIVLIVTSFVFVFNNSKKGNINKLTDLFDCNSYYAEYGMKIVSNKNENEYKIKEWYVNNGEDYKFRIETDNDKNNFIYIGNKNTICIKSDEQLSSFNLSDYNLKKENILSISSVFEILYKLNLSIENDSYINNNCCKIEEVEEDMELKYIVFLKKENNLNRMCDVCKKFTENGMNILKIEIVIDKERLTPKKYIVYDKSEEKYVEIVYNNFSINEEFDEKLFAF